MNDTLTDWKWRLRSVSTTKASKVFTAKKAIFLNMREDGIKQRSQTFKNKKKAYNRRDKSWKWD